MAQVDAQAKKPPYAVPWPTFIGFLDKLHAEGIPNRIDPTLMVKMSGQMQSYLTGLLKYIGAIDDNKTVHRDKLGPLVDPQTRKAAVAELLKTHYPKVVELGTTPATLGELNEAFTDLGMQGDPRRKAITFYLNAATYAGIPISNMWKAPKAAAARATGGAPKAKRKTGPKAKRGDEDEVGTTTHTGVTGGSPAFTVRLTAGEVTLTYTLDLFQTPQDERDFVLGLIDSMKVFASKKKRGPKTSPKARVQPPAPEPSEEEDDNDEGGTP